MDVTVRPRDAADLADLADVLVRVHAEDGYPVEGVANPRAWLEPARGLAAWTALLEEQPIGHISLVGADATDDAAAVWQKHTGGDLNEIAIPVRLFVDPAHRQRGAASGLMLAAYQYAAEHDRLMVFDVMEKDRSAIGLYESLGCQKLGTIEHDAGNGSTHPAAVYVAPSTANGP